MRNTISVVIPAYNAMDTIERAIKTVASQTHQPLEVIVVDDGSTDQTSEVVRRLQTDVDIVLIKIKNSGPSKARNTGIEQAKGDWLAFLDADDIWTDNNKLKLQIDKASSSEEIVLVDTFAEVYFDRESVKRIVKNDNAKSSIDDLLLENTINATSSVLVKKSALQAVGGFDEALKYSEDRLLWAKLFLTGSFKTVPKVCVYKENHSTNLTSKGIANIVYRKKVVEELLSLVEPARSSINKIWYNNIKFWFLDAYRTNSAKYFLAVAEVARKKCPLRFYFSPFIFLYVWFRISYVTEKHT